jgi:hypothetical protein
VTISAHAFESDEGLVRLCEWAKCLVPGGNDIETWQIKRTQRGLTFCYRGKYAKARGLVWWLMRHRYYEAGVQIQPSFPEISHVVDTGHSTILEACARMSKIIMERLP